MRPIDADELIATIEAKKGCFPTDGNEPFMAWEVIDYINDCDTIDSEDCRAQWISVKDRLPQKSGKYIVCTNRGNVYQTKFYSYPEESGGHWGQKDKGRSITHWRELPEAPDEAERRRMSMTCKHKGKVWDNLWCNVACMYCTSEQERTCTSKESIEQTNADRIRSMSDEELAMLLEDFSACNRCMRRGNNCFPVSNTLEWLRQPAGEDKKYDG